MTDSTSNKALERLNAVRKKAQSHASTDSQGNKSHLSPIKHEKEFFIADIFDTVTYRDDMASMEYPLFALKGADTRVREYNHDGIKIKVRPAADIGLATIHDKDIWIYCISKMCQAIYEGEAISRTVRFTIYDYLKSTNRRISGEMYLRTKEALDRLAGTRITIESENKKERIARGFGLIDSWVVVEEKEGRMVRVEVTLAEWLYHSITNKKLLSLSPNYFRLRKPLDRRIYELARKHCGRQSQFKVSLETLHKKSGSTASLKEFKRAIKSLVASDDLPDYMIQYDEKKDMVLFRKRNYQNLKNFE